MWFHRVTQIHHHSTIIRIITDIGLLIHICATIYIRIYGKTRSIQREGGVVAVNILYVTVGGSILSNSDSFFLWRKQSSKL